MKQHAFAEMGRSVTIHEPTTIIKPQAMTLKNNILVGEFCFLAGGQGLFVGNYIHISPYSSVMGGGWCVMEDFVGLSAGVRLITGSEDVGGSGLTNPTVPMDYRHVFRSHVHLKRHSFLATNVIVHPGVTIGEGSVVGSGSVVTKDLEPWGIYMGTPAKRVKDRPREKMLELERKLWLDRNEQPSDPRAFLESVRSS